MKVRDFLFRGFKSCTNGDCIIDRPKGMYTNASCKCLFNLSRSELHILNSRLNAIADCEVDIGDGARFCNESLKEFGLRVVGQHESDGEMSFEEWSKGLRPLASDVQNKRIEQLEAQVELLKKLGTDVLADASILFDNQKQDPETGEFAVDGEACHLLGQAIDGLSAFGLGLELPNGYRLAKGTQPRAPSITDYVYYVESDRVLALNARALTPDQFRYETFFILEKADEDS